MASVEKPPMPDTSDVSPEVPGVQCRPEHRITHAHFVYKEKSLLDSYILSVVPVFGMVGLHHFYLGRVWMGVAYCLTLGLFGVGYVVDIFRTPCLVHEYNRKVRERESPVTSQRSVTDTYILWFPCGLFGMHHFYLRNYKLAIVYLLTVGIFGIGWLVDLFRIPSLVRESNRKQAREPETITEKGKCVSYALGLPPLGLLGAHHFYLDRPMWGVLYANTVGLFGLGLVFDWFRMSILVKRANKTRLEDQGPPNQYGCCLQNSKKYIDDLFILWVTPIGLFGAHHFYLNRPGWGFAYLFTCGGLGVGWVIDAFRLQCLLRDYEKNAEENKRIFDPTYQTRNYVGSSQQNSVDSVVLSLPRPLGGAVASSFNEERPPQYQVGLNPVIHGLPDPHRTSFPTAPPPYTDIAAGDNKIYPNIPPKW
ncbi:uncharacterized protein LOC135463141 [Liolophura sinensis]|uniref:uncharacterized protein LOC135463141 n=1 Tax=Liolophura sinensis TaxID=3198878 RepID=UPI003157F830